MEVFLKNSKCPIEQSAKKFEIMLTIFIAEHNLSFSILNHLNNLIKEAVPDLQIVKKVNINRRKAKHIVVDVTDPENSYDIQQFCQNNYYSIVVDESSDCSVSINLAVVIRMFNKKCMYRFLGLIQIEDSTSNGIFEATMNLLKENNIPINNMVGITTDNCAVMTGKINGLQSKFKNLIPN